MPTFVIVLDFTDRGRKDLAQTIDRAEAFTESARARGAKVIGQYWTTGPHDGLLLLEAPDGDVAAGLAFKLGAGGAVRAHLSRAFDRTEIDAVDLGAEDGAQLGDPHVRLLWLPGRSPIEGATPGISSRMCARGTIDRRAKSCKRGSAERARTIAALAISRANAV